MAKKTYRVASPEGAAWSGSEVDSEVKLDLEAGQELAVVCAGWLEPVETKKKEG